MVIPLRENDCMMWFGEIKGMKEVAVIPCEEMYWL